MELQTRTIVQNFKVRTNAELYILLLRATPLKMQTDTRLIAPVRIFIGFHFSGLRLQRMPP
jgi:hypothetical protein